jgi:hypothetical protein
MVGRWCRTRLRWCRGPGYLLSGWPHAITVTRRWHILCLLKICKIWSETLYLIALDRNRRLADSRPMRGKVISLNKEVFKTN